MLDNANQQLEERSLAGTPQLEVRKEHLRCANDRKACTHPSRISLRQLWGRWEIITLAGRQSVKVMWRVMRFDPKKKKKSNQRSEHDAFHILLTIQHARGTARDVKSNSCISISSGKLTTAEGCPSRIGSSFWDQKPIEERSQLRAKHSQHHRLFEVWNFFLFPAFWWDSHWKNVRAEAAQWRATTQIGMPWLWPLNCLLAWRKAAPLPQDGRCGWWPPQPGERAELLMFTNIFPHYRRPLIPCKSPQNQSGR